MFFFFFFSSRRRHTRSLCDWSSRRVLFRSNELARSDDVYLDYRIAAIFAIANTHDARGEIDTAFNAYEAAHTLSRERDALEKRSYSQEQDAERIQRIADLWERLPEIA